MSNSINSLVTDNTLTIDLRDEINLKESKVDYFKETGS